MRSIHRSPLWLASAPDPKLSADIGPALRAQDLDRAEREADALLVLIDEQ